MTVSLHTAVVGAYLQTLPKIAALVDKAEAHCRDNGLSDEALTGASLAPDMWPFAKQVMSVTDHSARAIACLDAGVFGPNLTPAPTDFASLRGHVADAIAQLEAVDPTAFDARADDDMRFEFGTRVMPFTVADFLLTFSLPNFHFHATSAYAVLRSQGLPIGKMDYLGAMRLKMA